MVVFHTCHGVRSLSSIFVSVLQRYDIVKMAEGKWLNDECVNLYMKVCLSKLILVVASMFLVTFDDLLFSDLAEASRR